MADLWERKDSHHTERENSYEGEKKACLFLPRSKSSTFIFLHTQCQKLRKAETQNTGFMVVTYCPTFPMWRLMLNFLTLVFILLVVYVNPEKITRNHCICIPNIILINLVYRLVYTRYMKNLHTCIVDTLQLLTTPERRRVLSTRVDGVSEKTGLSPPF